MKSEIVVEYMDVDFFFLSNRFFQYSLCIDKV